MGADSLIQILRHADIEPIRGSPQDVDEKHPERDNIVPFDSYLFGSSSLDWLAKHSHERGLKSRVEWPDNC